VGEADRLEVLQFESDVSQTSEPANIDEQVDAEWVAIFSRLFQPIDAFLT